MKGFRDLDCPACHGIGEHTTRRDRRYRGQTAHHRKCRRCKGTGVL